MALIVPVVWFRDDPAGPLLVASPFVDVIAADLEAVGAGHVTGVAQRRLEQRRRRRRHRQLEETDASSEVQQQR